MRTKSQGRPPDETLGPLDPHLKEYIGLGRLRMFWSQTVDGLGQESREAVNPESSHVAAVPCAMFTSEGQMLSSTV